ncbi:MAG: molybdopterin-dependent oxidoreductase [Dehalococcoidia bacterium]|jgi:predicted molibdopterin-dependent oxidoreductase YjgC|nr:molybdopterin-dependent oxidoreductase [Dehalococcoidia bacterium]
MADEITIAFDGVEVKTRPGKMVLEAAIEAGIYIPYLCYHPGMKPYGACRMCVVGVEGGRGYPASCTLPVQDGMKIRTEMGDVRDLRRSIMEMLIAEHPSGCLTCHRVNICGPGNVCLRHVSVNDRCVTCPKNERCELKDTVRYLGVGLESPLEYKYRKIPLEVGDPFYDRDYNLCIVCGRCVRACEELRGDSAICFTYRGGAGLVGTSFGASLLESGCEFCGACIDVCPVGALVEREHKWEKPARTVRTVCPHCPVGCQLNLEINSSGRFVRAVPELHSPANQGQACFKGKFGLEFISRAGRLETPLIRRGGRLEEATWDEALDLVASKLGEYKGESFVLLTSPNSTNEEHYLAQKFVRVVMQSNNVDQTSDTQPELTISLERSLGYAAATNSIWDLEQADCILVFNSNVTEEQNVVGVPIKKAAKKGAKLIVIDPREVELTRYSALWLRPAPGTELLLLGGILRSLIDQGLERSDWLDEKSESPATLHYALHTLDMDELAQTTRVSRQAISDAARLYGQAGSGAIVYALDNVPEEVRGDCARALTDLALLTGNLGKPGSGLYPMRQGANEQGASDVGCRPDRLPGYGRVTNEEDRQAAESAWGCVLPAGRGLGLAAALQAAREGQVRAMLVIGDSANFNNGKLGDGLAALEKLEFLVVHDTFLSPAAQRADVVLPRVTFAEKEGTFTNLERRIQKLKPALRINGGEARPESWVISQVARRMNAAGFEHSSAAETMDEIARLVSIYSGVTYQRLEEEGGVVLRTNLESPQPTQVLYAGREHRGIQWPCAGEGAESTPTLYSDAFPLEKAEVETPQFRAADTTIDPEYPMWFVPGRVLMQADRQAQVIRGRRNQIVREEWVELNPADAAGWEIEEGDSVEVHTLESRLKGRARLTESVPAGVVAATTLFGRLAVDLQASEELDPASKVAGLDICRARVVKLGPAPVEGPQ